MAALNRARDQLDQELLTDRRKWYRLLSAIFLLATLSLIVLPTGSYGIEASVLAFLSGFIFLVLSIVCGILGRRWVLVGSVLAIVGAIVAMVCLPVLLRSHPPYEPYGVSNLRTINTAQITYLSSSGGSYGTMTELIDAKLLDDTFTGTRAGYRYTISLDAMRSGYTAEAVPALAEAGRYGYYSFPDAVVRYSMNSSLAPAGQSGKPVQ